MSTQLLITRVTFKETPQWWQKLILTVSNELLNKYHIDWRTDLTDEERDVYINLTLTQYHAKLITNPRSSKIEAIEFENDYYQNFFLLKFS